MLLGTIGIQTMLLAQDARPTFRARVERVTLSATVRTGRGRAVTNLKPSDFQLYDSGQLRTISEMRTEPTPVSLGLLVDFSGSMDVAARRQVARRARAAVHRAAAARRGLGGSVRLRQAVSCAAAAGSGTGQHPAAV